MDPYDGAIVAQFLRCCDLEDSSILKHQLLRQDPEAQEAAMQEFQSTAAESNRQQAAAIAPTPAPEPTAASASGDPGGSQDTAMADVATAPKEESTEDITTAALGDLGDADMAPESASTTKMNRFLASGFTNDTTWSKSVFSEALKDDVDGFIQWIGSKLDTRKWDPFLLKLRKKKPSATFREVQGGPLRMSRLQIA